MADAADTACLHVVRSLEVAPDKHVDYVCLDCGRVHATVRLVDVPTRLLLDAWAARCGVPAVKVDAAVRRGVFGDLAA